MARYLISLFVIVGLGYWAYSSWQDHIESDRAEKARDERTSQQKRNVSEMALKANAATDWLTNLADGGGYRSTTVLTAELQKQWLVGRPILFLGNIQDISINADSTYQIKIHHNFLSMSPMLLWNTLQLDVRCTESLTAPLLTANKTNRSIGIDPDIAVLADIDHIVTSSEKGPRDEPTLVLTGVGKCVNAMHLKESITWP